MRRGLLGVLFLLLGAMGPAASQGAWLGFLGVPVEDFPLVRSLGARTVEYRAG
ncbi:hypothetical protein [Thermus thermophilus]|uniref:Uncharacterized protein n=1 Tax=Thermus thermophilus TaxID=274 RepID=A0A7R7TGG9_THETH|nr:hypothetical protein [Thermus thermophilus]BCP67338.1 hypothetical protein TthHB5018_b22720 [Thermus thermophilus]BCP67697.1 hypothetical protein TthHB5018_d26310 [Thermus thermophilus]